MKPKLALAAVVESREDFYSKRAHLIEQELSAVDWLRQACDCVESEPIFSSKQIPAFAEHARKSGAQALIIHIPIWSEPIFSVKLARQTLSLFK